ncbi:hypothetical protein P775_16685 [Puniceibacterium antarcticum]|uniref:Uncharacterized protein n=1 Tax=Puniceibacterium antarcticum TaxID=1206336 RepID=A0A2G8RBS2_9RHOB|nr:hypothetical protein P775_16685 [Puniceibacterium antarcticum]
MMSFRIMRIHFAHQFRYKMHLTNGLQAEMILNFMRELEKSIRYS